MNRKQISFSYIAVVKKLTLATYVLYNSDGTEYDFGIFSFEDANNIVYIAALWIGSGLIYFLDMQIWWVAREGRMGAYGRHSFVF